MLFPVGTAVIVEDVSDPFVGTEGLVIGEPTPLVRTVRLILDDASTGDRCYFLTQLRGERECVACGDALVDTSLLCARCNESPVAA